MRSEDGFCHGAGLEQAETEQNSVAHNAPNGVDGVPGNCHALDQHGINCHADEDEKALKAQCEQAFQVVLPMWLCSWLPKVAMGMGARLTMQ